jgi:hypothetical protein
VLLFDLADDVLGERSVPNLAELRNQLVDLGIELVRWPSELQTHVSNHLTRPRLTADNTVALAEAMDRDLAWR